MCIVIDELYVYTYLYIRRRTAGKSDVENIAIAMKATA